MWHVKHDMKLHRTHESPRQYRDEDARTDREGAEVQNREPQAAQTEQESAQT